MAKNLGQNNKVVEYMNNKHYERIGDEIADNTVRTGESAAGSMTTTGIETMLEDAGLTETNRYGELTEEEIQTLNNNLVESRRLLEEEQDTSTVAEELEDLQTLGQYGFEGQPGAVKSVTGGYKIGARPNDKHVENFNDGIVGVLETVSSAGSSAVRTKMFYELEQKQGKKITEIAEQNDFNQGYFSTMTEKWQEEGLMEKTEEGLYLTESGENLYSTLEDIRTSNY